MAVAIVGAAIATINTPVRLLNDMDPTFISTMVGGGASDFLNYVSNHVKGMGQFLLYGVGSQVAYGVAKEAVQNIKHTHGPGEAKRYEERIEDHSVKFSLGFLAMGFIFENGSRLTNKTGAFDYTDMAWYAVGAALAMSSCKAIEAITKRQYGLNQGKINEDTSTRPVILPASLTR